MTAPVSNIYIQKHFDVSNIEEFNNELKNGPEKQTFVEKVKTQKAKGVFYIYNNRNKIKNKIKWNVPKHVLFDSGEVFTNESFNYPVFARPCPTVPRHGFVDSVVCKNADELNHVSLSTLDVESNTEILITKPIDAKYNLVISGDTITVSTGNDGATSGKNCKHLYMSEDVLVKTLGYNQKSDDDGDKKLIVDGELPFFEVVICKEDIANLVQMRSAPGTPPHKDYVPRKMVVQKIIKAEGDLLEWEEKAKNIDKETTVIDHIGGSLSSHFAIHAIVNGIAIFTTELPEIGSLIEPNAIIEEITEKDKENFTKAFIHGFNQVQTTEHVRRTVKIALSVLHNYSALHRHKDFELLGLTLGMFSKTTFATAAGESRYTRHRCQSSTGYDKIVKERMGSVYNKFHSKVLSGSMDRDAAYNFSASLNYTDSKSFMADVYRSFDRINWSGSYGGPRWANCSLLSLKLFNAALSGQIKECVELFNSVIHAVHNGGKFLNKISDTGEYDYAAKDPSTFLLTNIVSTIDVIYPALMSFQKEKGIIQIDKEPIDYNSDLVSSVQKSEDEQEKNKLIVENIIKNGYSVDKIFLKATFQNCSVDDNNHDSVQGIFLKIKGYDKEISLSSEGHSCAKKDPIVEGSQHCIEYENVPRYWELKNKPYWFDKNFEANTKFTKQFIGKKINEIIEELSKTKVETLKPSKKWL